MSYTQNENVQNIQDIEDEEIDINNVDNYMQKSESNVSNSYKRKLDDFVKIKVNCLKCIVCSNITKNPQLSPCCFNLICTNCHKSLTSNGELVTCPQCRKKDVKFNSSVVAKRIIDTIITKCPIENCGFEIEREFITGHLNQMHDKTKEDVKSAIEFYETKGKLKDYYEAYFPIHRHTMMKYNNNEGKCDAKKFTTTLSNCKVDIKKEDEFYYCKHCNVWICTNCVQSECTKYYSQYHPHELEFVFIDSEWKCNGQSHPEGCRTGNPFVGKGDKKMRYRCSKCDYNLCGNCMDYYYKY